MLSPIHCIFFSNSRPPLSAHSIISCSVANEQSYFVASSQGLLERPTLKRGDSLSFGPPVRYVWSSSNVSGCVFAGEEGVREHSEVGKATGRSRSALRALQGSISVGPAGAVSARGQALSSPKQGHCMGQH